jgi:hypothetical protein
MSISCYGVAGVISGYGTQYISQTSSKPFTIPVWGEDASKTDNAQKTDANKNRDFTITDYDPFKDIAETGNVNLPEYMQTKTQPKRSDEEILRDIEELAKEHARTGIQNEKRLLELRDEYISSVSPDRDGILKSTTNEICERLASEMYIGDDEIYLGDDEDKKKNKELIDYLMEELDFKKGKEKEKNDNDIINDIINNIAARGSNIATSGNMYSNNIIASHSDGYYTTVDIDRGGGKITSLAYDRNGNLQPGIIIKGDMYEATSRQKGVVSHALFYDENKEMIMIYKPKDDKNNKLIQIDTKAEAERSAEMGGVYSAAYDFMCGNYNQPKKYNGSGILLEEVNGSDRFTANYEAYIRTYEKLKNNAVA